MATHLTVDDRLVRKAVKVGGHKSKEEAVNAALKDYVRLRGHSNIADLFGKVDYWPEYDPKQGRKKR